MHLGSQRFAIKLSAWVRPLFLVMGATPSNAWVSFEEEVLRARLGYYEIVVPTNRIDRVERSHWPWYGGLGVRSNLHNSLALLGTIDNIVLMTLKQPVRATVFRIPIQVTQLYLSMEEPERFMEAVESVLHRDT